MSTVLISNSSIIKIVSVKYPPFRDIYLFITTNPFQIVPIILIKYQYHVDNATCFISPVKLELLPTQNTSTITFKIIFLKSINWNVFDSYQSCYELL